MIYRATILMKLDESSPVKRKDVERVAKRWAHRWYRNASSRGPDQTDKEFRQRTCNWLRFASRLRESDRVPVPHHQEVDALCQYMDAKRGLSPKTIQSVRQSLRKFFQHTKKKQLITFRIADEERYFIFLGKKGWTRAGVRGSPPISDSSKKPQAPRRYCSVTTTTSPRSDSAAPSYHVFRALPPTKQPPP